MPFIGAMPLHDQFYYHSSRPKYIYDLNCTGVESNIWDCPYNNSYHYCNDAAVICQGIYSIIAMQ